MSELDVQYGLAAPGLPDAEQIQTWVDAVLQQVKPELLTVAQLTVRLVDLPEGIELNETWRHKSGATNVLSFPFEAPPGIELPLLGDVIICVPVIRREAEEQEKAEVAHCAHMVVHGVLHLLGYDHLEIEAADFMENMEIQILHHLGYPNPYQSL